MACTQSRSFGIVLLVCGLLIAAGLALYSYSRSLPVFSVPYTLAMAMKHRWCTLNGDIIDREAGPLFWRLIGDRYWIGDTGAGLVLIGAAVAALAIVLRLLSKSDEPWLRTPRSQNSMFAATFCAFLFIGFMNVGSIMSGFDRGFLCSDALYRSAPFIPIVFGVMGALAVGVMAIIGLGFGPLPASLLCWDDERPLRAWTITLVMMILFAAVTWLLFLSIPTSDNLMIPGFVILLYEIAALRAALLTPLTIS